MKKKNRVVEHQTRSPLCGWEPDAMNALTSPLLTDLYHLNMIQAYLDRGQTETAVFEFFVRKLPPRRGFLLAAGLEQALCFVEALHFTSEEVKWLAQTGRFERSLLDYLASFHFTGKIHAVPEGRIVFENEPILRVTAPMPQAQLLETRLINILHFQTLIASKAARLALAAPGKLLVDFGLRRAHEAQAGLMAARASYIAGFAGTATLMAEHEFGIPIYGTMAHSFIEASDSESAAFKSFARSRPKNLTLLLDTYDSEKAAHRVVALAPSLAAQGITIRSVRLDSGDLVELSKRVRAILNAGGLGAVTIFASGGLDEDSIREMLAAGAPIDGFGVGTSLTTSSDVPALDCAYKLQEYAGAARRKRSTGKATWPGRKQVWRRSDANGSMVGDVLSLENDAHPGEPLLVPVMRDGKRLQASPSLTEIRARAAHDIERLPPALQALEPDAHYPVTVGAALVLLAAEVDERIARSEGLS
jgi:nicotinate phosphoribosyltransferase